MNTDERVLQLRQWCKEKISNYSKLKDEIMGLYELAVMEIEDGASVSHEIDLCMSDVEELINENYN
jgi:hypothetical protein